MQNIVKCQESIDFVKQLSDESVHLILSDIPYGISAEDWDVLHDNSNSALLGASPAQKRAGSVFKKRGKPINGWSEADKLIPLEYQKWCLGWAPEWLRVLKPGGSAIVFAGRRYAHRCISAMEDTGFNLKDMIAWIKSNAPHRAQRLSKIYERRGDNHAAQIWENWRVGNLRPIFEPVLWFVKPYKIGGTIANNVLMNGVGAYNEKAFILPDNMISEDFEPKERGLHPTQKPVRLMESLIKLTTRQGQTVLDPYCGSGSTLLAAKRLGRFYLGCDLSDEYVNRAIARLSI